MKKLYWMSGNKGGVQSCVLREKTRYEKKILNAKEYR